MAFISAILALANFIFCRTPYGLTRAGFVYDDVFSLRGITLMNWSEQVVLVTGGTGSFGRKFVELMLREYRPQKLIIFSRDELKQHDMRASGFDHPSLRYFIGDVRDAQRLERALSGVTVVVHTAALKQVPACEYNPFEAIQTNIMGGRNVIDAAINRGVRRILALSTDKAVNPINLYGATKLCAEKMFVQANAYSGAQNTRFSCARYGNVLGSRGSVIPMFQEQRKRGKITHHRFAHDPLLDHPRARSQICGPLHRADARGRDFCSQDSQHEAGGNGRGNRSRLRCGGDWDPRRARNCTRCCSRKMKPATRWRWMTCM